jgi:hypothetical protein
MGEGASTDAKLKTVSVGECSSVLERDVEAAVVGAPCGLESVLVLGYGVAWQSPRVASNSGDADLTYLCRA